MRYGRELLLLLLLLVAPPARAADALAVDVVNASELTPCAEKDNVYLKLQSARARRFTVEAVHPAYIGTIVKMFQKPGDPPPESFRCAKCEDAKKNAPVLGLTLIEGMKRNGLKYEDGTILDPRDGNVWRALMQLSPDGRQLEVRGYLRFEWAGKSQMWKRLPDNAMDPPKPAPAASKGQKK